VGGTFSTRFGVDSHYADTLEVGKANSGRSGKKDQMFKNWFLTFSRKTASNTLEGVCSLRSTCHQHQNEREALLWIYRKDRGGNPELLMRRFLVR
jgi:hypothetical protein